MPPAAPPPPTPAWIVFTQWFFGVLITSVVVGAGVLVLARVLVDRWRAARAEYFQKLDEQEETRKKEQEALAVAKAKKLQLAGLMPPKKPSKVAPNSFPDTPPPANLVTRQSLEDLRSKRLVGRQFRDACEVRAHHIENLRNAVLKLEGREHVRNLVLQRGATLAQILSFTGDARNC
jgi:hypothetical protein